MEGGMFNRGLASGLVCIGGGLVALGFALFPGTAQAGCTVTVEDPRAHRIAGQRTIVGYGKRGIDCKEKKIFHVRLRQHRTLWPDKTLAEVRFTLSNARLGVRYVCRGAGTKAIFTEAWVEGDTKYKSRYKEFEACG
jgi:hypothetical protein